MVCMKETENPILVWKPEMLGFSKEKKRQLSIGLILLPVKPIKNFPIDFRGHHQALLKTPLYPHNLTVMGIVSSV